MKKVKFVLLALTVTMLTFAIAFGGCSKPVYVTDIVQTSWDDNSVTYTIYYSNGTTSKFTVTNGANGANGADVTIKDVYDKYVEQYGYMDYNEFLKLYLSFSADYSTAIANSLNSTMKLYTEFVESTYTRGPGGVMTTVADITKFMGSAVIWSIDDSAEGYTYILTNYHVVYDVQADVTLNNGHIARKIYGYLYGSEYFPVKTNKKDADGYTVYDYGTCAIECEYVGGAATYDLAVIRAKTADLKAVNDGIKAVTLADNYYVGQAAIAVGNAQGNGLSVTQGVVSVDNEYITLNIDGVARSHRSIRIDAAIYEGSSGGGLFNANGQLIGLTNAGRTEDESINYAIPLDLIKPVVDNVLYYYREASEIAVNVNCVTLGVTVAGQNSKYVYNAEVGYGQIYEQTVINTVSNSSIASAIGLQSGDIILSLNVNQHQYQVNRTFYLTNVLLTVRAGDTLTVTVLRNGNELTTEQYHVTSNNLSAVA